MMTLDEFIQFYDGILSGQEKAFFPTIANKASVGYDCFCSAFIARYDSEKGCEVFLRAFDKDSSLLQATLVAIALESVYIRSKNDEILDTGYAFLQKCYLSHLSTYLNEDAFLFAVLCDKLRFFSTRFDKDEKSKYIKKRDEILKNYTVQNQYFALSPLYLMAFSLEKAESEINSFVPVFTDINEKDLLGIYFTIFGLYTYGYDDKATEWKNALLSCVSTARLSTLAYAIIAEIILMN